MRQAFFVACCLMSVISYAAAKTPAYNEDTAFGRLSVYSDVPGADIYVDAKFVGQDRATVSNLPAGKHYVRVVKNEKSIQSGIVDVREGEETIIVAKPTEEELLSQFRKPNLIHLYASYSGVNYIGRKSGTAEVSGDMAPFYGLNVEGIFPIPVFDINLLLGFRYNLPATLSAAGAKVTDLTISGPYLDVSKKMLERVFGNRNLSLGLGGGFNYSFYSGQGLSITGQLGYGFYGELALAQENQTLNFRGGYLFNTGNGSNGFVFTNSGIFFSGGVAYKL